MTTSSHSEISVPHSGGFLRLSVDVPDHDKLTPEEAEFINRITDMVYGRLRDMIGERAAAQLSDLNDDAPPGGGN